MSEAGWRPMSEAPRDGTKILVLRKPKYNMKHPVVLGKWTGLYWRLGNTSPAQDDDLLGWRPPLPTLRDEKCFG